MFNIFSFIPFIFLLITSYLFNRNKLNELTSTIVFISILEATFSYFIVYLIFLEGFIQHFYQLAILIFFMLITGYIVFYVTKDLDDEWDIQIETIKNNLIVFTTSIVPLYVFLTIFRFLDAYLQILFSIVLTAIIFFLSFFAKKFTLFIYNKIKFYTSNLTASKFYALWTFICLIIVFTILFDLPTNKVSQHLNLSNNVSYLRFDGYPTNIKNTFKSIDFMQINLNKSINTEINDYYYNQEYLYLYTKNNDLIIYDLSTETVSYHQNLGSNSDNDDRLGHINRFTQYDDYLLLLAQNGLYLITADEVTNISPISSSNTQLFYSDNQLYYLLQVNDEYNTIYQFKEGTLSIPDNYNTTYDKLYVISEHLFSKENNRYHLYDEPTIFFSIKLGVPVYDHTTNTMYYTVNESYPDYEEYNTKYQKVSSSGKTSTMIVSKNHNIEGIIFNRYLYFTGDMNRVEILTNNLKIHGVHNHLSLQPFWIGNKYYKSYIGHYQVHNNRLEYLQVDQNKKNMIITIQQLEEYDVDIQLPFYTHYGLGIFVLIVIAFFIPITNYRKGQYVTIGTILNKKK